MAFDLENRILFFSLVPSFSENNDSTTIVYAISSAERTKLSLIKYF